MTGIPVSSGFAIISLVLIISPVLILWKRRRPSAPASTIADPEVLNRLAALQRENERLRQEAELLRHEQEDLELVREMLELRALADLEFRSPIEMLQEFVAKLGYLAGFERTSLYLFDERGSRLDLYAWGGCTLSRKELLVWQRFERAALDQSPGREFGMHAFPSSDQGVGGAEMPFRSGLIVPVPHEGEQLGFLVLTTREWRSASNVDRRLLAWGAEFLVQTLARTIDRALIEEQARRDGLTRLANRHTFDQEFKLLVEGCTHTGQPCSLILLDLDHFKRINDTCGHAAGDAVLKAVGERISSTIGKTRVSDRPLVARYGGEEFAVLLPGVSATGAERIAELIRRAVADEAIRAGGRDLRATLSAGVATGPQHGRTPQSLFTAADEALYAAKEAGRNRVVQFVSSPDVRGPVQR